MNIAFIISEKLGMVQYNGIRIQAETWAKELERQGHAVTLVNPWIPPRWESFDVVHIFGYCESLHSLELLQETNVVFSPIIDTKQPVWKYKWITHWGLPQLRLQSPNNVLREASRYIKCWYVRSHHEYQYVYKAYGIPQEKISIIPLSYRLCSENFEVNRGNFCLHVSKLTDTRKNVMRLIDAAIKYEFPLILAGSIESEIAFKPFKDKISQHSNIKYLGKISNERLLSLYKSAKVFALPSINEGVGMVAIEAAACGCEIVVTNVGGPKEYYNGMAFEVDPLSIDSIGKAVVSALYAESFQPKLQAYVKKEFSQEKCVMDLVETYKKLNKD